MPKDPTPEEYMEMMLDAPQDAPLTNEDLDAMYAEWCARHGVGVDDAADGHKDHHYWAA